MVALAFHVGDSRKRQLFHPPRKGRAVSFLGVGRGGAGEHGTGDNFPSFTPRLSTNLSIILKGSLTNCCGCIGNLTRYLDRV